MIEEGEKGIIADPSLFSEDFIPAAIPNRELQIKELHFCLAPMLKGEKPLHCWVYGNPGTGKTAVATLTLEKLQKQSGIKWVYVNCWEYNTFYAVVEKIVVDLRILRADKLNTTFKLERFQQFIGDKPFLVVLDEIDHPSPKERDSILYNLCNIGRIGVIGVCNSKEILFEFDDRVKSRLNPTRIEFPSYTVEGLIVILRQRAERGLHPNSLFFLFGLGIIFPCSIGISFLSSFCIESDPSFKPKFLETLIIL
jgi:cell division control protein 6